MINRKEREELNALSKELFGSSSRWEKLVAKGCPEMVTEQKTDLVPPTKEGEEATTKTVTVPVKTAFAHSGNGAHQYTTKHYTVDSIKEYMLQQKIQLEELRARIKKYQEDAKAAQEAKEVADLAAQKAKMINDQMGGSAI